MREGSAIGLAEGSGSRRFRSDDKAEMQIPLFQIDAFTSRVFAGNPAAVCPLDAWLPEATMQAIAAENNLSETAFFVRLGTGHFDLRWFTPTTEVDLCGHATLASAHVVWYEWGEQGDRITFESRSGPLPVHRRGDAIALDLPRHDPCRVDPPDTLAEALGALPLEVWAYGAPRRQSLIGVFPGEDDVRSLTPDFSKLREIEGSVVMVTAPGTECAFVSRFFAPFYGIDEDPVTGSAHCALGPLWAGRLGEGTMRARQVSRRGGELEVQVLDKRVIVSGRTARFMEATLTID